MEGVIIRDATRNDIEGIQRVARASWHAAHDEIIGPDEVDDFVDEYYDAGKLEEVIGTSEALFFVAVDDASAVVGFVVGVPTGDVKTTYSLRSIYVDPDRWGAGIGRRLLSRLETAVQARGGDRIELFVMTENAVAIDFYESTGFHRVRTEYNETHGVDSYGYAKDL